MDAPVMTQISTILINYAFTIISIYSIFFVWKVFICVVRHPLEEVKLVLTGYIWSLCLRCTFIGISLIHIWFLSTFGKCLIPTWRHRITCMGGFSTLPWYISNLWQILYRYMNQYTSVYLFLLKKKRKKKPKLQTEDIVPPLVMASPCVYCGANLSVFLRLRVVSLHGEKWQVRESLWSPLTPCNRVKVSGLEVSFELGRGQLSILPAA